MCHLCWSPLDSRPIADDSAGNGWRSAPGILRDVAAADRDYERKLRGLHALLDIGEERLDLDEMSRS